MKKAIGSFAILTLCALALSLGFLVTGCESGKGLESLFISPESVTLTATNKTVIFTAGGESLSTNDTGVVTSLARPLQWYVSDPNLGSITKSSGTQAVYTRTGANGDNTVIVKDQYDNEGYATVTQQ